MKDDVAVEVLRSSRPDVMVLEFTESTLNVKTVMLGGKIVDEVDLNVRK